MNGSPEMVRGFAKALTARLQAASPLPKGVKLGICPTFLHFMQAKQLLPEEVFLGAQDAHFSPKGAYSGDVSARMLHAAGAVFCLVGHSERRHGHGENTELIHKKLQAILTANLCPVLCVGETLAEREANLHQQVVAQQVVSALQGVGLPRFVGLPPLFVAYEPVWAIGTGLSATPEQVNVMHQQLRQTLITQVGSEQADRIPLLYGGSVNAQNVRQLLSLKEVNGALVGGASLVADSFWNIASLAVLS